MTAADCLPASLLPEGKRQATIRAKREIAVYERPGAFAPLATILAQLNHTPFDANAAGRVLMTPQAAIISDAIDDPIGLCASLAPGLPKILISSNPGFGLRCDAARVGVEAIIRRPVDINELSDWLDHFDQARSDKPISVLIVDDDCLTADIHAAVLESAGMNVTVVPSQAGLPAALALTPPDIILMDIQMPGIDGIDLARVIRQSREYLAIPIAFLSVESNEARQMAARRCGGDDFIQKPVEPRRLVSLVQMRAERARTVRTLIERDSLTGLLNHRHFQDRTAAELVRSQRTGSEFSLVMIDLDHFKAVNDTSGHATGDKVLRSLARLMSSRLRRSDVTGRYGGEEFGILLIDTSPAEARHVVEEIKTQFGEIVFEGTKGPFSVTFSAGIAGSCGSELKSLFANADRALYKAKKLGRNCVTLSSETGG